MASLFDTCVDQLLSDDIDYDTKNENLIYIIDRFQLDPEKVQKFQDKIERKFRSDLLESVPRIIVAKHSKFFNEVAIRCQWALPMSYTDLDLGFNVLSIQSGMGGIRYAN